MSLVLNPLSPDVVSVNNGSVELSDVLDAVARKLSLDLRVCLPAVIVAIDGNQLVDVQPLLKQRYVGAQQSSSMRVISQLPVSMPMGQDWACRWPIAIGDTGYLICADRSLDNWLAGDGSEVDPDDARAHTLQDAIFVPGLVPTAKQSTDVTSDMVLHNGAAMIRLEKSGRFRVSNNGQELVAQVIALTQQVASLIQIMQQGQVLGVGGPNGFWQLTQTSLAAALQSVQTILSNIETLEGT